VFNQATADLDADRRDAARAGFEKILARVPEHAPTLRRLSYVVGALGDSVRALELARHALRITPGRDGKFAVAEALTRKHDAGSLQEAGELAEDLLRDDPSENEAGLVGSIAMARQDISQLGRAIVILQRRAPNAVPTNFLGAIYHAALNQPDEAEALLEKAVAAGLPVAEAERFRAGTGLNRIHRFRMAWHAGLIGLGVWVLGLFLIFVVGRMLSAIALRAIDQHAADPGDGLIAATRRLRRIYTAAIGFAAVYYYVSIPIVVALVVGLSGGLLYGILVLGWIPIKLVFLLVIGAALTVWALIRSAFARARRGEEDPGRRLPDSEAPALWATLREVAGQVGTRPVDDVFLTPGTEVAVAERGPMMARLRDKARRHLILGAGVLEGMTQGQLRAVLAHEYGHFSNRDTAGGDVAATVQTSLMKAAIHLATSGSANIFNPAWHFLRLFFALFQRITLGASRLQEVMADRFAATIYGGAIFAEGLRHVTRRSVQFSAEAGAFVERAKEKRTAIANLYVAPEAGAVNVAEVDAAIEKAMTDPGSPYDSHPPVARRIDWVARFQTPAAAAALTAPAWSLFSERARIEAEMTDVVNKRLSRSDVIDD
jgi:Zn-dependent protease with chaperone function